MTSNLDIFVEEHIDIVLLVEMVVLIVGFAFYELWNKVTKVALSPLPEDAQCTEKFITTV